MSFGNEKYCKYRFFQAYRSFSENGSYILSLHSLFCSSQWSHNSHCSTYKHNTRTLTGCRLSVQRVYRDLISRTRTVSEIAEVGLMWRCPRNSLPPDDTLAFISWYQVAPHPDEVDCKVHVSRNVGIPRMDLDTEEIRETHNFSTSFLMLLFN